MATPGPATSAEPRRPWRSAWAVCRFELQVQRRDPATALFALVFLLLTFAFVSSGTVELVRDRGALPKLSPLALTLAFGGLTAFGQVITTMVVASAFLRDAAWRTDQLLFATPLAHRSWVLGRWLAAVLVMTTVSSALVVGALAGAAAPWVPREVPWSTVVGRALLGWLTVTVPTTVAVASLLTAVAVRSRRLLAVLGAALLLVFLWQGCEALRRAQPSSAVAALADPFGTVAVQQVAAGWSDAERAIRTVPPFGAVGGGRALWLLFGLLVGGAVALREPAERVAGPTGVRGADRLALRDGGSDPPRGAVRRRLASSAGRLPSSSALRALASFRAPFLSLAAFTTRWTWRDRGWLGIAALGMLNVAAHGWFGTPAPDALATAAPAFAAVGSVVALVQEHARLFLILLATIYGGELLWRDVDERVVELVHSAPVRTARLVGARLLGIAAAEAALVGALLAAGWAGLALGAGIRAPLAPTLLFGALWLYLPFVQWTVLSLTVHVLVRHKVAAHLLLIAGWVLAVALDANGASAWWIRFADPPPLAPGQLADAWQRAAWWSVVSAALRRAHDAALARGYFSTMIR